MTFVTVCCCIACNPMANTTASSTWGTACPLHAQPPMCRGYQRFHAALSHKLKRAVYPCTPHAVLRLCWAETLCWHMHAVLHGNNGYRKPHLPGSNILSITLCGMCAHVVLYGGTNTVQGQGMLGWFVPTQSRAFQHAILTTACACMLGLCSMGVYAHMPICRAFASGLGQSLQSLFAPCKHIQSKLHACFCQGGSLSPW